MTSTLRMVYPYHSWGEKSGWFDANAGSWSRYMLFVGGREVRFFANNVRYYYHQNYLGTATMVTRQNGTVAGERLHYPWGDRWESAGVAAEGETRTIRVAGALVLRGLALRAAQYGRTR